MKKYPAIISAALCVSVVITVAGCAGGGVSYGNAQGDAVAPVITVQPGDIQLRRGEETVGLKVVAYSNDGGSLSYQWYSAETDENSGGTAVEGATQSIYVPEVSADGVSYYYCVVTNTNLSLSGKTTAETVSDSAEVKVYSEAETPRIVSQPQGSSYVFGAQDEALPISVEAAVSKGELTYQWYSSSDGAYENASKIENANSSAYIPDITNRGKTYYFCEITNTDASASENKTTSALTKLACVSIDYEYSGFIFEAIDENTTKLTAYNGSSLRPYIPETDEEGRVVTEIGPGVFAGTPIVEITIPDTVTVLGIFGASADSQGVFYNCTSLQTVNFGGHFTEVGDFSFSICSAIQTDVWAMCDRLERLGNGAFQYVNMPQNFVFPATLSGSVGDWTFQHAKNIKTVTFAGDGVTSLGGSVFTDVSTLESVVIPASVTKVGDFLKKCPSLKSVTFERSVVADGSITAGVPFEGEDYPELVIYVPEDSYSQYCASLGGFSSYVKAPARTLTVEGAMIDGNNALKLENGQRLDPSAEVAYDNDSWVCWLYEGKYYSSYDELAATFVMGGEDVEIRVLYDYDFADYSQPFTPSCVYQNIDADDEVYNGTHELLGETQGTRYVMDTPTDIKILNGPQETHEYDNGCPVSASAEMYMLLTFKNNKNEAITIRYEVEYWGVRGMVTVELSANGTRMALLVVQPVTNQTGADTSFHQLRIVSGGENGYDITIAGRRPVETHTLTIEGATIDGENTLTLLRGEKLDAAAEIVYEGEPVVWECDGVYFQNYAEFAEKFAMGGNDVTAKVLYAEDFADYNYNFTPSCLAENMNDGADVQTMEHVDVNGYKATRYVADTAKDIKIRNGSDEKHGAADGVYNDCPVSGTENTYLLMTFVNNDMLNAITIRYEVEYWGVRGSVTVELPAGGEHTALIVVTPTANQQDAFSSFHQLRIVSGGENGYDISIYGRRSVAVNTLTIEGATIDGQTSMELFEGGVLDAGAEVVIDDAEGNLGWIAGGKWYETYSDLAKGFRMGGEPATIVAATADNFTIPFTPTCRAEDKNNYTAVYTMSHVEIAEGFMGTRYKMEAGGPAYIKITNGELEEHTTEDGVYNECPISSTGKTCLLLTFVNNSETAVTFRYEAEYFGVKGSVEVALEGGESKTVLLVQSVSSSGDNPAPYHQMEVTSGAENGYDITVYGYRAV